MVGNFRQGSPSLNTPLQFEICIGLTRSRKIESDGDYQKNKERFPEFKILWKNEKLHSTIHKYEGANNEGDRILISSIRTVKQFFQTTAPNWSAVEIVVLETDKNNLKIAEIKNLPVDC